MSLYYCFICDNLYDEDYVVCYLHPEEKAKLICENCDIELEEERELKEA